MPRRFGIELEFCEPSMTRVQQVLCNNGIGVIYNEDCTVPKRDIRRYTNGPNGKWRLTSEGDVPAGGELVSPIFHSDNIASFASIANVINILNGICEFDEASGLHVHVEVKDFTALSMKAIVDAVYRYSLTLEYFAGRPPDAEMDKYWVYEKTNDIIRLDLPESETLLQHIENLSDGDDVNPYEDSWMDRDDIGLASFLRQGTVEFRRGQGSTCINSILRWINVVLHVTEWASRFHYNLPALESMSSSLDALVGVDL